MPPVSAGSTSTSVIGAKRTLAELRTLQDWYIRYGLTKAHGVAEVASIGGFVKTYAVTVDPRRLKSYGIPLSTGHRRPSGRATRDVGGRVIEMAETEYVVRGRGYLRGIADLEQVVLKADGAHPSAAPRRRPHRAGSRRATRPDRDGR